jgi:hypothetical protein
MELLDELKMMWRWEDNVKMDLREGGSEDGS